MKSGTAARRVTIAEVATRAAVSIGTASNVLNGRATVKPASRERVLAAAQALGYSPDGLAAALARGRSTVLGLCISYSTNPSMAAIVQGAGRAARAAGYVLTVSALEDDPVTEAAHLEALIRERVAAVMALGHTTDPTSYLKMQAVGIPVVFLTCRPPGIAADLVTPDYAAGTRAAVGYLLDAGRRVALLTTCADYSSTAARVAGCRQAYAERGLDGSQATAYLPGRGASDLAAHVSEAMDQLLCASCKVNAVVCGSAPVALEALGYLRRRNVCVPNDVALVGIGTIEWADLLDPPLAMVEVDSEELGRQAVGLALARLSQEGREAPPHDLVLPVRLVIRRSAAQGAQDAAVEERLI